MQAKEKDRQACILEVAAPRVSMRTGMDAVTKTGVTRTKIGRIP